MDMVAQFCCQQGIDHAVAFEAALAIEGIRHDMNAEMALAAQHMIAVPGVQVGLVDDVQALWRERVRQLFPDDIGHAHGIRIAA